MGLLEDIQDRLDRAETALAAMTARVAELEKGRQKREGGIEELAKELNTSPRTLYKYVQDFPEGARWKVLGKYIYDFDKVSAYFREASRLRGDWEQ